MLLGASLTLVLLLQKSRQRIIGVCGLANYFFLIYSKNIVWIPAPNRYVLLLLEESAQTPKTPVSITYALDQQTGEKLVSRERFNFQEFKETNFLRFELWHKHYCLAADSHYMSAF